MNTNAHSSKTMRILPIVTLTMALAHGAQAQAPSVSNSNTRTVSLQELIEMTMRDNVNLQVERYQPRIAAYNLRGAYGAYDPTFSLSGRRTHSESGPTLLGTNFFSGAVTDGRSFDSGVDGVLPWGTIYGLTGSLFDSDRDSGSGPISDSDGSVLLSARQPLLRNFWIDNARLAIRFNRLQLNFSEQELKRQTMETINLLENAYFDLISARENVVVRQKAVDLAEQLLAENRKRVEVGAMAPLEAKQAESQAATARADLLQAQSELAVLENRVKELMNARYAEWAAVSLIPAEVLAAPARSFDLQESWRKGLTSRPEMLQIKIEVERAGVQLKYDRNQIFPQLDLFATYGYDGSGTEFSGSLYDIRQRNRPTYSYGASISIPLSNLGPRNAYKASKLSHQQAVLRVKEIEALIMRQIDDDIKLAQASFERIAATRAAREYAEQALQAEQKKLEQGQSTTYTVLQTQRDLTQARAEEIRALNNYNKNLSDLSLHEGSTLERLGIDFKAE